MEKIIIIGSGPAGYTSAIYASRARLAPLLIEGPVVGGQLTTTNEVENFPGYPTGVTGSDLVEDIRSQAKVFGTRFKEAIVVDVIKRDDSNIDVYLDNGEVLTTETLVVSTGASAKYLGLESEQYYLQKGSGVSACATCDGFFYGGEDVCVIGGGDTALEEAMFLSNMCTKVNLVVRGDKFRASQIMVERLTKFENIEVHMNSIPVEFVGDGNKITGLSVDNFGEIKTIQCSGIFVAIGHTPNTSFLNNVDVERDASGYIITNNKTTHTSVDGIFACGDVADNRYRQAITAAGTGCMSAMDVEKYLMNKK